MMAPTWPKNIEAQSGTDLLHILANFLTFTKKRSSKRKVFESVAPIRITAQTEQVNTSFSRGVGDIWSRWAQESIKHKKREAHF